MALERGTELARYVDRYLTQPAPASQQARILALSIGSDLGSVVDQWVGQDDSEVRVRSKLADIREQTTRLHDALRFDDHGMTARHVARQLTRRLASELLLDFSSRSIFEVRGVGDESDEFAAHVRIHDLLYAFDARLTDGHGLEAAEALIAALDRVVTEPASVRWRQLAACVYGLAALSERSFLMSDDEGDPPTATFAADANNLLTTLEPKQRLTSLDEPRLALVQQVVEPLQDLARSLVEDGRLESDDEAELRSLLGAVTLELQNPRHDVVSLERNVGRLAVAVSRQQAAEVSVERLVAQLDVDVADAERLVGDIKDLTESNTIGNLELAADVNEAAEILRQTPALLEDLVARTIHHSISDPDGPIARHLHSIDERLARRPGAWPTALAQNLAASALFAVFVDLGGPGIALRAVVWTIIAVYQTM